jgi:acetate---CoA ligase (ADP-forming)
LSGPDELRVAYDRMSAALAPGARARLYVQKQVPQGWEVLCGFKSHPGLPAAIAFGLGGIWVEALADVRFRLAPLTRDEAWAMIRSIRAFPLLEGNRGARPADLEAVAAILVRLSEMAAALPEILEAELNPVFVFTEGRGALAVDARIRVKRGHGEGLSPASGVDPTAPRRID